MKRKHRGRLLLIDDDEILLSNLQEGLALRGYEVDTEMLPEDALRRLAENDYELVITDLKMASFCIERRWILV